MSKYYLKEGEEEFKENIFTFFRIGFLAITKVRKLISTQVSPFSLS